MRFAQSLTGGTTDGRGSRTIAILTTSSAVVSIVTPIASVIAILLKPDSRVPAIVLGAYLCLLTTALLLLLIRNDRRHHNEIIAQERFHHDQVIEQELRTGRASRYAPAMVPLRKAYGCLGNATWTMVEGDGSEESFIRHLRDALQFLAEAFSLVTDQPCRTVIKMTYVQVQGMHIRDPLVYTLCRSDESDAIEPSEEVRNGDSIRNNSDFRQIFEGNAHCFFCNDLPAELANGYQNSHWDSATIKSGDFRYRSAIVWPIARARPLGTQNHERREVIGFLCVDTPAVGAFNETFDVPIGTAFCGVLHLALHRFRASQTADVRATTEKTPEH
ncbi:hypothetical protein [Lentzea sp. CA-135723]|uniref:hypothetical protein n=1 Tax=Lentzea sp. CA-135723 TaxID=3239950 RepID=UPI003D8A53DD